MEIERIDGKDYEVGSEAHSRAVRERAAWRQRYDESFVEDNGELVESHHERLRSWAPLVAKRLDANSTAFLARDLVFMRAQIERTIYERLRMAEIVPVDPNYPPGAEVYSVRRTDRVGEAKVTTDLAGDAPRVDVTTDEDLRKFVFTRASYAFTVHDLEKAALAKVQIQREKALACAEAIATALEKIGRSGAAGAGLTGLLNNGDVVLHTLTNGEWLTATADEIIADLNELEALFIAACGDNLPAADVGLWLPTTYEGRLATLQRHSGSDITVKDFFLKHARVIKKIDRLHFLGSLTTPDVAASDAPMGLMFPKDPLTLFWPFSIPYEEQAPELRGFEWIVQARARCGGVDFRRPFQALYFQNLD